MSSPPIDHEWTWDEGDPEFDIPDGDLYCRKCFAWRNYGVPEEEEPPCGEGPKAEP